MDDERRQRRTDRRQERRHHERRKTVKPPSASVSRTDFDALARRYDDLHEMIQRNQHNLSIQFQRIAQLQVAVDRCTEKVGLSALRPPPLQEWKP